MKMIFRKATKVIGAIYCLCGGNALSNTDKVDSKLREGALTESGVVVARMNAWLKNEGYAEVRPFHSDVSMKVDARRLGDVIVVGGRDDACELSFSIDDLLFREFESSATFQRFYGHSAVLYDSPTTPQWTEDEAKLISRSFLEALLRRFPGDLGPAKAEYVHRFRQMPKFYPGLWTVQWERVDGKGHEFLDDFIMVEIGEKAGPISAIVKMNSVYQERAFRPISLREAGKFAREGALAIAAWIGSSEEKFPPLEVDGSPERSVLKIVNPNHLGGEHVTRDGAKFSEPARLAWLIEFKARFSKEKSSMVVTLTVWIDAETGRFLGGTYF